MYFCSIFISTAVKQSKNQTNRRKRKTNKHLSGTLYLCLLIFSRTFVVVSLPLTEKISEQKRSWRSSQPRLRSMSQKTDDQSLHFTWNTHNPSISSNKHNTKLKIDIYFKCFPDYHNMSTYLGLPWNILTTEIVAKYNKSVQSLKSTWVTIVFSHLSVSAVIRLIPVCMVLRGRGD